MRSLLIVSAHDHHGLACALDCEADALIVDVEDSSGIAAQICREAVAEFLQAGRAASVNKKIFVKVHGLDTALIDADLDTILPYRPDGIFLSRAQGGSDLQHLGAKLAVREAENELPDGSTLILPVITETPAALFAMNSYAGASRRACGLTWGVERLAASLGSEATRLSDGDHTSPFVLARNLTLFAAAHAGVDAVDAIFETVQDLKSLRAECEIARRDGFAAKLAIHPDQVSLINEVFTPSAPMVERALAVVSAFEASPDASVALVGGQRHDLESLGRARRLLARRPK